MTILQINKMYAPDIGGVETVVRQYAHFSLHKGHTVTVLCCKKIFDLTTSYENDDGVSVIRCASLGTFFSMPVSLAFFYHFFKLSRQHDILHFHEPFPLAALCYYLIPKKVKVVITWHCDIVKQKFFKFFVGFFQKKLLNRANSITTTSPNMITFSPYLEKISEKITILPLSVNLSDYKSVSFALMLPPLPPKFALFIGRFSYYKGLFVLLEAMKNLSPDIKIVIAGDGALKNDIIEKTKNLSHVTLIPRFVSEDEKNYLLEKCSFFLFPSLVSTEAFGITQLEAMAFSKPVINTDLPTGVPWVSLNKETGLTVKSGDENTLKEAIETLWYNDELCLHYGRQGRKRVEQNFSDKQICYQLQCLYQKMF